MAQAQAETISRTGPTQESSVRAPFPGDWSESSALGQEAAELMSSSSSRTENERISPSASRTDFNAKLEEAGILPNLKLTTHSDSGADKQGLNIERDANEKIEKITAPVPSKLNVDYSKPRDSHQQEAGAQAPNSQNFRYDKSGNVSIKIDGIWKRPDPSTPPGEEMRFLKDAE